MLLALRAAAGADADSLHAAIQGRWRADTRALAEQVPGWKTMSPRQRETVLAILPPMSFEITADRIVLKASGPGEQDEPVTYAVIGAEGRKLELAATDAAGEKKSVTVEMPGPNLLILAPAEGPALRLLRVRPDPSKP